MRIRELIIPHIMIALTNEENHFLNKHHEKIIDLKNLEERESRIAENLIIKDVLCKIGNSEAMVNKYVSKSHYQRSSK